MGVCSFEPRAEGEHLEALARAIVYQQLSGKAAATIYSRVSALLDVTQPIAAQILALTDESLRAAGLSRQKISYLRDLATKIESGELRLHNIESFGDADIQSMLCAVKGVGRWTAQMFLMFRLGRSDVLPDADLGIRKAVMRAYRLRSLPSPDRVRRIGAAWTPWSSIACWYLWRSLEVTVARPAASSQRRMRSGTLRSKASAKSPKRRRRNSRRSSK